MKNKKHIVTGILAHVDAGKTTLSEAILYTAGNLRKIGRAVRHDHHSFYVVYLCEADFEKDSIVLQEGETIGYKWVDKETLFKLDGNELASSRTLEIVKKLDL